MPTAFDDPERVLREVSLEPYEPTPRQECVRGAKDACCTLAVLCCSFSLVIGVVAVLALV